MHQPISRSFAALFIAVMLLCAVTVAGTLFQQASTAEEIAQLQAQVAEADAEAAQTAEAIDHLNDALAQLQVGMPLAE